MSVRAKLTKGHHSDSKVAKGHQEAMQQVADMELDFSNFEQCVNRFLVLSLCIMSRSTRLSASTQTGLHALGERYNQLMQEYIRLVKEDVIAREEERNTLAFLDNRL